MGIAAGYGIQIATKLQFEYTEPFSVKTVLLCTVFFQSLKKSIVRESKKSIVRESKKSIVRESKKSIVLESKKSIVGQSKKSIVLESKKSIVGESKTSIVGESKTSIVGESKTSIVGESKTSIFGEAKTSIFFLIFSDFFLCCRNRFPHIAEIYSHACRNLFSCLEKSDTGIPSVCFGVTTLYFICLYLCRTLSSTYILCLASTVTK